MNRALELFSQFLGGGETPPQQTVPQNPIADLPQDERGDRPNRLFDYIQDNKGSIGASLLAGSKADSGNNAFLASMGTGLDYDEKKRLADEQAGLTAEQKTYDRGQDTFDQWFKNRTLENTQARQGRLNSSSQITDVLNALRIQAAQRENANIPAPGQMTSEQIFKREALVNARAKELDAANPIIALTDEQRAERQADLEAYRQEITGMLGPQSPNASGGSMGTQPAQNAVEGSPPTPRTQAEFDAIPSGTMFVHPSGQLMQKP